jgi:hypothetical protein
LISPWFNDGYVNGAASQRLKYLGLNMGRREKPLTSTEDSSSCASSNSVQGS